MSVSTIVDKRPLCDMCRKAEAQFDGKTKVGPWAYMCLQCYRKFGIGLGTGKGQRLYLRSEVEESGWLPDPARHDDGYDPEPVDYSAPTKYDIVDGEV